MSMPRRARYVCWGATKNSSGRSPPTQGRQGRQGDVAVAHSTRREARARRQARVRQKIAGTAERPRLNVFRSLAQMYAQVIDDGAGRTMASASTLEADVHQQGEGLNRTDQAKLVGRLIAERPRAKGIR